MSKSEPNMLSIVLRYCLGLEYVETRSASAEEQEHVRHLEMVATRRYNRIRLGLLACLVAMIVAVVLMFSIGFLIFMADLFVILRLLLAYRDAKKPLPLLWASINFTEVATYSDPTGRRSVVIHPNTGLLIRSFDGLTTAVIKVDGVGPDKPELSTDAGWYPAEMEAEGRLEHRRLSPSEIIELKRLTRHVGPRLSGWLLLASWVLIGCLVPESDPKNPLPPGVPPLAAIGLVIIVGIHLYWNRPLFNYWRDRVEKRLVRAEVDGQRIEFLPHSRLVWTEDGIPSAMRRDGTAWVYQRTKPRATRTKE